MSSPKAPEMRENTNGTPTPTPTPPPTPSPKLISRSHETPTTFVQADTATFKQVVQMLTGSSDAKTDPSSARGGIPPIKSTGQKKQGFKLYERRNSLKNGLMINTLTPGYSQNSSRKPEILSPSILDFPSLLLSPLTPDTMKKTDEENAIADKKFYFHPSPRRDSEPQLLPLFPVTSPRVSGSN